MLTKAAVKAIYNASKKEYDNSYAMMIDDAMEGARKPAKKYNTEPFCDAGFFPIMYRYIRNHRRWEDVTDADVQDMRLND